MWNPSITIPLLDPPTYVPPVEKRLWSKLTPESYVAVIWLPFFQLAVPLFKTSFTLLPFTRRSHPPKPKSPSVKFLVATVPLASTTEPIESVVTLISKSEITVAPVSGPVSILKSSPLYVGCV